MRSRWARVIFSLPGAAVSASSGRCESTGSSRLSAPSPSSMPMASEVTVFETENTSRRMSAMRRRSPPRPSSATTWMESMPSRRASAASQNRSRAASSSMALKASPRSGPSSSLWRRPGPDEAAQHLAHFNRAGARRNDGVVGGEGPQRFLIVSLHDAESPRAGGVEHGTEDHHLPRFNPGSPVLSVAHHDLALLVVHVQRERRTGGLETEDKGTHAQSVPYA